MVNSSDHDVLDDARKGFFEAFGRAPEVGVRAPGRVNLLGGHTDYNEGFVLPAAVNRPSAIRPLSRYI